MSDTLWRIVYDSNGQLVEGGFFTQGGAVRAALAMKSKVPLRIEEYAW